MLVGLNIRDVVLIEALDLEPGAGLTALTGETGAGKSIVLDALGLATGARGDAGLVRHGATQAVATAVFDLPAKHRAWALLADKGVAGEPGEDLVLRRQVSADGRSRAFVNDQAVGVGVLKELGGLLLEVHGQHDSVGLLDPRTHRALLDDYGDCSAALAACRARWSEWREALKTVEALRAQAERQAADAEHAALRLAELDRLDPHAGEEAQLADERGLLGAAEKIVADISAARDAFGARVLADRLSQGMRALERARDKAVQAGGDAAGGSVEKLAEAVAAGERTLLEAQEAVAALDAAARAFVFEPARLERTEERLFALRAMARKLGVQVDDLPAERIRFAEKLHSFETADEDLSKAEQAVLLTSNAYRASASDLSAARTRAGERLSAVVEAELKPLKLEKARFRTAVEAMADDRWGPEGADRVAFEISTNAGAPFGPLNAIASGGELARFALALKVALATRGGPDASGPTLIFDEVDQGVGGAVADAVGLRLKRLAGGGQVLVVTHSPQVAARADVHWRVSKAVKAERTTTAIVTLDANDRQEELARMLAGAQVTDAARAAAKALMGA